MLEKDGNVARSLHMMDLLLVVFIPAFTVLAGAISNVLCHERAEITHFFWGVELSLTALAFTAAELSNGEPILMPSDYGNINVSVVFMFFVILMTLFQITIHRFYYRLGQPMILGVALATFGTTAGFLMLGYSVHLLVGGGTHV